MDGVQFYLAQRLGAFPQRLYPPGAAQSGHSGGQGDTGGGGVAGSTRMSGYIETHSCKVL